VPQVAHTALEVDRDTDKEWPATQRGSATRSTQSGLSNR
jgi:hypothetical protein